MTDEFQKIHDEVDKTKKRGKKRDAKAGPSETTQMPKKKQVKKVACRQRYPTPSDHEDLQSHTISEIPFEEEVQNEDEATSQPKVSKTTITNPEVSFDILTCIPINDDFFQDFSVPSPTSTISTPITIDPCPLVFLGVLQTDTPLFNDSTTPTTTSSDEPPVTVNASDVGEGASGFIVGHSTPPITLLHQDDPDTIYGGNDEDFGGFTYSPFNIRTESDNEAHVTKGQLKAANEKLDSLLQSSKTSTNIDYSNATIKSFLETLTKEHSSNLQKTNKVVDVLASINK